MFVLLRAVGDDAHIVPAEYVVLRKSSANSQFYRVDVGIDPYKGKITNTE